METLQRYVLSMLIYYMERIHTQKNIYFFFVFCYHSFISGFSGFNCILKMSSICVTNKYFKNNIFTPLNQFFICFCIKQQFIYKLFYPISMGISLCFLWNPINQSLTPYVLGFASFYSLFGSRFFYSSSSGA
jgi:hypothetical protein